MAAAYRRAHSPRWLAWFESWKPTFPTLSWYYYYYYPYYPIPRSAKLVNYRNSLLQINSKSTLSILTLTVAGTENDSSSNNTNKEKCEQSLRHIHGAYIGSFMHSNIRILYVTDNSEKQLTKLRDTTQKIKTSES